MQTASKIFVIAGPSGSGKSTLLKRLFAEYPDTFGFSVSRKTPLNLDMTWNDRSLFSTTTTTDTTRAPRAGEVNGKDYHFVAKDVMEREVADGKFIESATFSGNMYGMFLMMVVVVDLDAYRGKSSSLGTSVKAVEDVVETGKVCMLDIDMQGVQAVKKTNLNPRYICIRPPSLEILEQRLRGRGTEKEEGVLARLEAATRELEYAEQPGVFDRIIVNDDLEAAYKSLKEAIFTQ